MYPRIAGTYRNPISQFVKVGGVWRQAVSDWTKVNGEWRRGWVLDSVAPAAPIVTGANITGGLQVTVKAGSEPDIRRMVLCFKANTLPVSPTDSVAFDGALYTNEAFTSVFTGLDSTKTYYARAWLYDWVNNQSNSGSVGPMGFYPSSQVGFTYARAVTGATYLSWSEPAQNYYGIKIEVSQSYNGSDSPPGSFTADIAKGTTSARLAGPPSRSGDATMYVRAWAYGPAGLYQGPPARTSVFFLRTPIDIGPNGVGAYGATGGAEGNGRIRAGNTSSNYYRGLYTYGTQVGDYLAGRVVTGCYVYCHRDPGSNGTTGAQNEEMALHNYTSLPGEKFPTIYGIGQRTFPARGGAAWMDVGASYGQELANVYSGRRGVAVFWNAADVNHTYVGVTRGTDGQEGNLRIYHNDYSG